MSMISCPKCSKPAQQGSFHTWQIIVAICFFPVGLIALLLEKQPSKCMDCGHMWT
jgi:hypothetical protein